MLFIIIFNDNYCIFMFNYRGKSEEYKEYTAYNECHEEFKVWRISIWIVWIN